MGYAGNLSHPVAAIGLVSVGELDGQVADAGRGRRAAVVALL